MRIGPWRKALYSAGISACVLAATKAQTGTAEELLPPAPIAMTDLQPMLSIEGSTSVNTTEDDLPGSYAEGYASQISAETPGAILPPAPLATTPAAAPPAAPKPPATPKKPAAPPAFPGPKNLPPTGPYKGVYFLNDFSYKKEPKHDYVFGEELKLVPLDFFDESIIFSTGGEIRHRFMQEDNRLRPGGPIDNDNQLWRWRHYVDAKYEDVRVYAEGIHAESFDNEAPDQAIDVNQWDLQNVFVDWMFLESDFGKHTIRYGRQELLFGRQRLISPLDWANTRRNFEGFRHMLKGETYTLDSFYVNPVNSATGFNSVAEFDNKFDSPNDSVSFSGSYFSYTGQKNTVVDLYWLYLNTEVDNPTRPDGSRHTIGSRYGYLHPVTDCCGKETRVWDLDIEGGWQFGEDNTEEVSAGFLTSVLGHTWKNAPLTPRVSGQFYYGSGDRAVGSGDDNTFNVLFPLGHAYWAISDNLAGQNLLDYSLQVDIKPTKKSGVTTSIHWFNLASNGDTLYNVAGGAVGTPGNGRDVGQALDLYGYYAFNPNFDIQAGQSWFWYGEYIDATAARDDATQFYVQTSFRY